MSSFSSSSTENHLPHKHAHDKPISKYLSKFREIISQSSKNLQIKLIEPILYFQGNPEESLGCFMRGELIMNLDKPTKIKRIEMNFYGRIKTYWPQCKSYYGSRTNNNDLCEERELINHHWAFLSSPAPSSPPSFVGEINNKDYHLLPAGVYTYPFELFLPGTLPETIQAQLGNVAYKLHATAIKAGISPNLHTSQQVTIIRTLSEELNSQGIAISRDWLGLINYEITIPNKAYSIGDSINIDLKTSPQVKKVRVLGLRMELNEQIIYRSRGQQNTESKVLSVYRINDVCELNSDRESESDTLYDIYYHKNFVFPLPKCSNYIHISCTWPSITISHNLKFYINVKIPVTSKKTGNFTDKFKKEVIEIDVPITLLSCRCADNLPQYDESWVNLDQDYSHDLPPSYETYKRNTFNPSNLGVDTINDDNRRHTLQ